MTISMGEIIARFKSCILGFLRAKTWDPVKNGPSQNTLCHPRFLVTPMPNTCRRRVVARPDSNGDRMTSASADEGTVTHLRASIAAYAFTSNHVREGIAKPRPQVIQSMLARSVGRKVVTDNFDLLPAESRQFVWVTDYWATSGFYVYAADVSEIGVLGSDQLCT